MSEARTRTTQHADGELPTALCHYCTPRDDGTSSTLHPFCIGYQPGGNALCSCTCPNATKRRESRGKPWVSRTSWKPAQRPA